MNKDDNGVRLAMFDSEANKFFYPVHYPFRHGYVCFQCRFLLRTMGLGRADAWKCPQCSTWNDTKESKYKE